MMASNPMQRKSRNSFLLGMIITLGITGIIIAVLLFMLKDINEQLTTELGHEWEIYVLTEDVKAGQILTEDMFELKMAEMELTPSNATNSEDNIEAWFLQTKEGEAISTDKYGLYLNRGNGDKAPDTIIEVIENTKETFEDSKGKKIQIGDLYVEAGGTIEKVEATTNGVYTDEYGSFLVDTQGVDKITRVYQEELTDEFYILKINAESMNSEGNKERVKEYIDIKNVPVLAKVDMNANTVITSKLVVQSDEIVTADTRQEEYNMITLPIDLMTNDYVDIRLKTSDGQNFIVISKAQVDIPMNSDGTYIADTVRVNLREDEILAMSSAIVEAYGLKGAELYVTKYVDPAMQDAAIPTYTPNAAVTMQMQSNPNIVDIAKEELASRYSEAAKKARNEFLQQSINNMDRTEYLDKITQRVEQSMGTSLTTRKQYLDSLNMGEEEE